MTREELLKKLDNKEYESSIKYPKGRIISERTILDENLTIKKNKELVKKKGYVYIAETPLYEITYKDKGKEMTWFAYSDKEKNDILAGELADKKYTLQRSKGLGENDPEMMALTTMNPATRRLIKVLPEDVERTAEIFDLLLGDNLAGRKDHIANEGYKYLELADIS